MKQFYVYLHCKPDGTPFYVGKGCGRRAYDLNRTARGSNKHHKHIVAKYGKENIIVLIQSCSSETEAFEQEILHIQQLREDGIELCNFTDGGDGVSGHKHSYTTKQKISKALIGNQFALGLLHSEKTKEQYRVKRKNQHLGNKFGTGNKSRTGLNNSAQSNKVRALKSKGNRSRTGQTNTIESNKKRSESLKLYYSKNKHWKKL